VRKWPAAIGAMTLLASLLLGGATPVTRTEETLTLVNSRGNEPGYGTYAFSITAKPVQTLYPGVVRWTRLTVINPYMFPLKITGLQGEVTSSSRSPCRPTRDNVRIGAYPGALPFTIPRLSKRQVAAIPVSMPPAASSECAKTTFTIRLSGVATRAH
jgi:hypothetical protein